MLYSIKSSLNLFSSSVAISFTVAGPGNWIAEGWGQAAAGGWAGGWGGGWAGGWSNDHDTQGWYPVAQQTSYPCQLLYSCHTCLHRTLFNVCTCFAAIVMSSSWNGQNRCKSIWQRPTSVSTYSPVSAQIWFLFHSKVLLLHSCKVSSSQTYFPAWATASS